MLTASHPYKPEQSGTRSAIISIPNFSASWSYRQMSADPVEPPAQSPSLRVVDTSNHDLWSTTTPNPIPGPDLFIIIVNVPSQRKFIVDIRTFSRHSSAFPMERNLTMPRSCSNLIDHDGMAVFDMDGDNGADWATLIETIYDPM